MQDLTDFFGKYFTKKEDRKAALSKKKPAYKTCDKEEGHIGEFLNLVCLDKKCEQRGLICSLCKTDKHTNHTVVPLKTLLDDLTKSIDSDFSSPQESLTSLEHYYNNIMGNLSSVVETMAESFRCIEKQIKEEYIQQKLRINKRYQLQQQLPQIIESILQCDSTDSTRKEILSLLQCLRYCRTKGNYVIGSDPKQLAKDFEKKHEKISNSLFQIMQLFTSKTKELDEFLVKATVEEESPNMFKFSDTLKSKWIALSEDAMQAKQNESKNDDLRFAAIEPPLPLHHPSKISFQVKNLANWVGVGICLKNIVAPKNFKFDYSTIGHGSYLMSSNGYIWSNSNPADNIKQNGFSFQTGSSVTVEFDPIRKKVIYSMEGDPHPQKYEQSIDLTSNAGNPVHFCANLCSKNDEIRIL